MADEDHHSERAQGDREPGRLRRSLPLTSWPIAEARWRSHSSRRRQCRRCECRQGWRRSTIAHRRAHAPDPLAVPPATLVDERPRCAAAVAHCSDGRAPDAEPFGAAVCAHLEQWRGSAARRACATGARVGIVARGTAAARRGEKASRIFRLVIAWAFGSGMRTLGDSINRELGDRRRAGARHTTTSAAAKQLGKVLLSRRTTSVVECASHPLAGQGRDVTTRSKSRSPLTW